MIHQGRVSDTTSSWTLLRVDPPVSLLLNPVVNPVLADRNVIERINNAGTAFLYNPSLLLQLPPFLSYLPGSAQVSYPNGAGWVAFPDLTPTPAGLQWPLAALVPPLQTGCLIRGPPRRSSFDIRSSLRVDTFPGRLFVTFSPTPMSATRISCASKTPLLCCSTFLLTRFLIPPPLPLRIPRQALAPLSFSSVCPFLSRDRLPSEIRTPSAFSCPGMELPSWKHPG